MRSKMKRICGNILFFCYIQQCILAASAYAIPEGVCWNIPLQCSMCESRECSSQYICDRCNLPMGCEHCLDNWWGLPLNGDSMVCPQCNMPSLVAAFHATIYRAGRLFYLPMGTLLCDEKLRDKESLYFKDINIDKFAYKRKSTKTGTYALGKKAIKSNIKTDNFLKQILHFFSCICCTKRKAH